MAESDDWCEPTLLQTLVEGITPRTCIAFCQSIAVQDNKILYINNAGLFRQAYPGRDFVREKMLRITAISNASQAIFSKAAYARIDQSFTDYKFSGDWLFWMLVAQHGEVFVSGKCLNYFRKHARDVTSPSLKNGMAYREYLRTLATLQQHGVISAPEQEELLMQKFNEMLWDHRVQPQYVAEISQLYHAALGSRLLSLQAFRLLGKRSYWKALKHRLGARE
jgi:hypothetical protein